jgi:hypothetical protein
MSTAPADSGDVMAALDDDGSDSRLVIADVSREEAWVSVTADAATRLPEWR